MARRDKGEGTIFKRGDGRWCAKINVTMSNGEIKRVSVIKKDRAAVKAQLEEWSEQNKKRLPFVEENWTVASYITHWLNDVMPGKIRLSTFRRYKDLVHGYIIPGIGKIPLKDLGVHNLQTAIDNLVRQGVSSNTILKFRRTMSSCLTYAMRKEIIFRNVAQLVEIPKYAPKKVTPWTAQQALLFLQKTRNHRFHIAFAMMLNYGLREGEMRGLRWSDIDFANDKIHIRQQLDELSGEFYVGKVKTQASQRELSLISNIKQELLEIASNKSIEIPPFNHTDGFSMKDLLLVSDDGTPITYGELRWAFNLAIDNIGLPRITMHTMRHTTATLLKNMGVPVKDTQLILGHANILTTLRIYQHGDEEAQRDALNIIGSVLSGGSI